MEKALNEAINTSYTNGAQECNLKTQVNRFSHYIVFNANERKLNYLISRSAFFFRYCCWTVQFSNYSEIEVSICVEKTTNRGANSFFVCLWYQPQMLKSLTSLFALRHKYQFIHSANAMEKRSILILTRNQWTKWQCGSNAWNYCKYLYIFCTQNTSRLLNVIRKLVIQVFLHLRPRVFLTICGK